MRSRCLTLETRSYAFSSSANPMLVLSASLALAPFAQNFDPIVALTKEVEPVARTVAGDFNGDGHADLVLLGVGRTTGLIHLGDGAGSFAKGRPFDSGTTGARAGAAGDLNGDGVLDLVTFAQGTGAFRASIVFGVGDGSFSLPSNLLMLTIGNPSGRPRIVDVDADGDMDIVVGGDQVIGFRNLGAGVFAPDVTFALEASPDVAVGDMDGDGDLDLLHSSQVLFPSLFLSEQVGPFQFTRRLLVTSNINAGRMEVADWDGDGDLDVVLADLASRVFEFIENQGGGVFASASTLTVLPDWSDFEVSDVNRDGQLDIVGVSETSSSSFWIENVGPFSFSVRALPNAAEPQAKSLSRADFNGDGVDDFALTRNGGDVDLLLSDPALGAVPYGAASTRLHAVVPQFEDAVAVDLDGDGDADIVATTIDQGIYSLENIGFTSFSQAELAVAPVPNGFPGARKLRAVDVDGDSDQDIVCVSTQGNLIWLEGDGTGSLQLRLLDVGGPHKEGEVYPVDADGDGDLDLAVSSSINAALLIEQTSPGVFASSVAMASFQGDLDAIRMTDIDDDGVTDVALFTSPAQTSTSSQPYSLRWAKGNGDGTFQPHVLLFDGLQDAGQIELVQSLSSSFSPEFLWSSNTEPRIDGADRNVTSTYTYRQGLALLNRRAERFAAGQMFSSSPRADLVVQEGNGTNADPALLVAYRAAGTTFSRLEVVAAGLPKLNSISVHDLNGDHAGDILVVSDSVPRLSWIRSRSKDFVTTRYCSPAVPNMTGQPASIHAFNGPLISNEDYVLQANDLPSNTTTLFLTSQTPGFQPVVPGSIGTLCLGGAVGRFVGPGQVQTSSADGLARLNARLDSMPQPGGFVPALSGSVWFFQAWYRDTQAGASVSNFTDALFVVFQ